MKKRVITVSIIGVGARGGEMYGRYTNEQKDKFKIASLCDPNEERLNKCGDMFNVEKNNRFKDEETFFHKKEVTLFL